MKPTQNTMLLVILLILSMLQLCNGSCLTVIRRPLDSLRRRLGASSSAKTIEGLGPAEKELHADYITSIVPPPGGHNQTSMNAPENRGTMSGCKASAKVKFSCFNVNVHNETHTNHNTQRIDQRINNSGSGTVTATQNPHMPVDQTLTHLQTESHWKTLSQKEFAKLLCENMDRCWEGSAFCKDPKRAKNEKKCKTCKLQWGLNACWKTNPYCRGSRCTNRFDHRWIHELEDDGRCVCGSEWQHPEVDPKTVDKFTNRVACKYCRQPWVSPIEPEEPEPVVEPEEPEEPEAEEEEEDEKPYVGFEYQVPCPECKDWAKGRDDDQCQICGDFGGEGKITASLCQKCKGDGDHGLCDKLKQFMGCKDCRPLFYNKIKYWWYYKQYNETTR